MCTNLLHNLSFLDIYCVSRYNRVKLKFPNCHMILRNIKSLRKSNFKGWILNSVGKLPQLSISSPNKNSLKKRCIPFSGKLIPEIVTNVLSFSLTTKWLLEHWVFKTGLSSTSSSHIFYTPFRRKTKQNKTRNLHSFFHSVSRSFSSWLWMADHGIKSAGRLFISYSFSN